MNSIGQNGTLTTKYSIPLFDQVVSQNCSMDIFCPSSGRFTATLVAPLVLKKMYF